MISSFIGYLAASQSTAQNPVINLSVSSLTIASTTIGSTRAGTLTVTNTGTAPLIINSLSITGTNASEFSVAGCTNPVAPSSNCVLTVTFAPSSNGSKSATLTIAHNASVDPSTVSLSGTGAFAVANNWQQITTSPPGGAYTGTVAYGNGMFVVLAYFNSAGRSAWYSNDGTTWAATTLPIYTHRGIIYGANKFVAVSGAGSSVNNAAYSVDGINWTATTISTQSGTERWGPITYGNGMFVTLSYASSNNINGSRVMAYSTDGVAWATATLPATDAWWNVVYGNGKFVAVGFSYAAYSTDGITWTLITSGTPRSSQPGQTAYGDGKFVTCKSGTNTLQYSTDGINWIQVSPNIGVLWTAITYGGGKFVGLNVGASGGVYATLVYTSVDGLNWTVEDTGLPTTGSTGAPQGIVYAAEKYVASRTNAGSVGGIVYSG